MSVRLKHRVIGNNDFIQVDICGDWDDNYVELSEELPIKTLLALTASIIDDNSFYKDLFDSRLLS